MQTMLKRLRRKLDGEGLDSMDLIKPEDEYDPKADFAGKLPRQIDLVSNKKKIEQLNQAINLCTEKLIESKPVVPWRFTGPKDKIETAFKVEHVPGRLPNKYRARGESDEDEDSDDSEERMRKKNLKNRTPLYDKDYSEIKQYPWKFKCDEIDDEGDDDLPTVDGAPRRANKKKNNDDFGGGGGFFGNSDDEVTPNDTIEVPEFNF